MVGMGLPRAGHCRLTVLLALTVTSSTSSSVSPRITGGAGGVGGRESRVRSRWPGWEGSPGWGVGTKVQAAHGARLWLGLPVPYSPRAPSPCPGPALMQLSNLGHREGGDLVEIQLESRPLGI